MKHSQKQYWDTGQIYLAAYLFARGAVVIGVEASERKVKFTFIDSPELQEWKDIFKSGSPLVDARFYIYALQTLKSKARDALFESHD